MSQAGVWFPSSHVVGMSTANAPPAEADAAHGGTGVAAGWGKWALDGIVSFGGIPDLRFWVSGFRLRFAISE